MLLRDARPDDAEALADCGRRAFIAAFAHLYKPEDLARFLDEKHAAGPVSGEIADPELLIQLAVAEDGDGLPPGSLLGFAKVVRASSLPRYTPAQRPIELKQLYCSPDAIGIGVGARLMDWTLDRARAEAADWIELSVWSENFGAQKFYRRYGFDKVADIDFWVGDQRDEEFLFARPLG